jgi:hypothetical protein
MLFVDIVVVFILLYSINLNVSSASRRLGLYGKGKDRRLFNIYLSPRGIGKDRRLAVAKYIAKDNSRFDKLVSDQSCNLDIRKDRRIFNISLWYSNGVGKDRRSPVNNYKATDNSVLKELAIGDKRFVKLSAVILKISDYLSYILGLRRDLIIIAGLGVSVNV